MFIRCIVADIFVVDVGVAVLALAVSFVSLCSEYV